MSAVLPSRRPARIPAIARTAPPGWMACGGAAGGLRWGYAVACPRGDEYGRTPYADRFRVACAAGGGLRVGRAIGERAGAGGAERARAGSERRPAGRRAGRGAAAGVAAPGVHGAGGVAVGRLDRTGGRDLRQARPGRAAYLPEWRASGGRLARVGRD